MTPKEALNLLRQLIEQTRALPSELRLLEQALEVLSGATDKENKPKEAAY